MKERVRDSERVEAKRRERERGRRLGHLGVRDLVSFSYLLCVREILTKVCENCVRVRV